MAMPIITPTVIRGQLMFARGDIAFGSLMCALRAWSAANVHRLNIVEGEGS